MISFKEYTQQLQELKNSTLQSYKDKANASADELTAQGKHGESLDRRANVMKATGKQIEKTSANIGRALRGEPVKEEIEQIDELSLSTLQSYQAKRGNRDARMKTAVAAMDHIFSKKKGEPPHQIHGRGLQRARAKVDDIRKKQTEMNPQKPRPQPEPKTGFRSGAMDDTYGT